MSSKNGRLKKNLKSLTIPGSSVFGTSTLTRPDAAIKDFGLFETCDEAVSGWDPDWEMCPVCGAKPDKDGFLTHAEDKN